MLINFQGKSNTTMAHENKMSKYPVDTTSQNEWCLLCLLKFRLETDAISAGPK